MVLLNILVVILTLTCFEAFLWRYTTRYTRHIKHGGDLYKEDFYFRKDDALGYTPHKNVKAHATKSFDDLLLFDVHYTIDENGLRKSPPCSETAQDNCLLFFGCSMVFGEGLEDEETLPYQTGLLSGGKYKIFNFGFHGYGPHQMLSIIENGLLDEVVTCTADPKHIFYVGLVEHALRAAGKTSWGEHAPRYALAENQVYLAGRFDDSIFHTNRWLAKSIFHLKKSYIYQKISDKKKVMTDQDVQLFLRILKKSQLELKKKYPDSAFTIILWDNNKYQEFAPVIAYFKAHDINVKWINEILPNYDTEKNKYRIHPKHEKHPNARANRIIAQYLLDNLIEP